MGSCLGFSKLSNLRAWVKIGFAIQYLNTHIFNMLKLEFLAFFSKAADDIVSAINMGNTKDFFKCTNEVLKCASSTTPPVCPLKG